MEENHIQKGRSGEEVAALFLLGKGYKVLERNWRHGHKEVDIIAEYKGMVVFVEVKSRKFTGEERYNELINAAKQKSLLSASNAYMIRNRPGGKYRFDVIFVTGEGDKRSIEHIEDAFDSWG